MGNRPILIHNQHVQIGQAPKGFEVRRVEQLDQGLVRIWGVTGIRRNENPEPEAEVRRELLVAQQWPCVLTRWEWIDRSSFGITILFPDDLEWAFLRSSSEYGCEIVQNEPGRLGLELKNSTSVDVALVKDGKFMRLVRHWSEIKIGMGDWEDEKSLENAQADLIVNYSQKDDDKPPITAHVFPSFANRLPSGALLLLGAPSGAGAVYFCSAAGRESIMKLIWPQQERRGTLLGMLFVRRGSG